MKIKYYGTAAAEGMPAIFCRCDACMRAKAAGGRNVRTRSQACIDDRLVIDFPPDSYLHVLYGGLDLAAASDMLITHAHFDHLNANEFWSRSHGIAYNLPLPTLNVYGSTAVGRLFRERACNDDRVAFHELAHGQTVNICGYDVTALNADHASYAGPFVYIISDGSRRILYMHDSGYLPDESWEYLEKNTPYFDYLSLDCTHGYFNDGQKGHMGVPACRRVRDRLRQIGVADAKSVFVLNHFSHNGKLTYDELVKKLQDDGDDFIVSYDGMEITV